MLLARRYESESESDVLRGVLPRGVLLVNTTVPAASVWRSGTGHILAQDSYRVQAG